MTSVRPRNQWHVELELLLGDSAAEILAVAADAAGGELGRWSPRQVVHQPDRSTVVQYRTEIVHPDGQRDETTIVAAAGADCS